MKTGSSRSELGVAAAGLFVLAVAGSVAWTERPSPPTRPVASIPRVGPRPSPRPATRSFERFGPLAIGDRLPHGFRITHLAPDEDSLRIELRDSTDRRIVIGVSSKKHVLERPPPMEFPDLQVWYVGRGEIPEELGALARWIVSSFRVAANPRPPSDALEDWARDAR